MRSLLCTRDGRRAAMIFCALTAASSAGAQSIIGPPTKSEPPRVALQTPEKFFGFRMGADNKMAHWNDMVRYYDQLGKTSNRMKVVNMGKTSRGQSVPRPVHLVASKTSRSSRRSAA